MIKNEAILRFVVQIFVFSQFHIHCEALKRHLFLITLNQTTGWN